MHRHSMQRSAFVAAVPKGDAGKCSSQRADLERPRCTDPMGGQPGRKATGGEVLIFGTHRSGRN